MATSYADAASINFSPNDPKQNNDNSMADVKPVFLSEEDVFGETKTYLIHKEVYIAIGNQIPSKHLIGLQRIGRLWRIYLDDENAKKDLLSKGVTIRNKSVNLYTRNPKVVVNEKPDSIRVRVKNIPLSADDQQILRALETSASQCKILNYFRERLRVDQLLTNCKTGDRIFICEPFHTPLPKTMIIGKYRANVFHFGQPKQGSSDSKCGKCMQIGHTFAQCHNDWKCRSCGESGHKSDICTMNIFSDNDKQSEESDESDSEIIDNVINDVSATKTSQQPLKKADKTNKKDNPSRAQTDDSQQALQHTPIVGRENLKSKKKAKRHKAEQTDITQFLVQDEQYKNQATPIGQRERRIDKSPVTPVETLHGASGALADKKQRTS